MVNSLSKNLFPISAMKLIKTLAFLVLFLLVLQAKTQFWTEDFDAAPCASLCNPSTVGWTINATVGSNGTTANTWYVSCAENGNAAGACGTGCGSDNSLHVGNVPGSTGSLLCPGGDCGAAYDASTAAEITNKRCESPIINCTGQSTITLDFNYIEYGEPGTDECELWYYDGATWSLLDPLLETPCCGGPCTGLFTQGQWTAFSIGLPASADGNPNVQLGFFWTNDGNGSGADPSFAVDDLTLTSLVTTCDATITPAGPFCENDAPVNLSAADPGGTWSGIGITDPVNGTFDPSVAGPGSWTISYDITGSCVDSDTETIVVNAMDDASFNYSFATYCLIDPDPTPTITGLGGGTFTISGGGVINSTTGQIDIAASGAGTYTVTYTTNGTCPNTSNVIVTITSSTDATITPVGPFCESDAPINLNAVDPGGTWSGTGITDPVNGTFDPATAGPGSYTITYTISGSCGDTDTETIVVNADDDASFSYAAGSYCLMDPNPTPTITGTGGGTFSISGGGSINPATGQIDLLATGTGSYTITYTTSGVCPDSQTFTVTITTTSDASISGSGPFCQDDASTVFTAASGGGTWSGTGINPTTGEFDPSLAGPGTHQIIYTISGSCGDADTITVTVNPVPTAGAGNDTIIALGSTVTLNGSGGTSYSWSPSTDLSCTNCQNPEATPDLTTTYMVTVTDGNGCSSTASVTITVTGEGFIWVPNAFSPNGDGENDVLFVRGAGLETLQFFVYDRWGEKVFETMTVDQGWDGSYKGQDLNTSVFVYYLRAVFATGEEYVEKGNISLIR